MSEITNEQRAELGRAAVGFYVVRLKGERLEGAWEDYITDLIVDLLHLAAFKGEDPEDILWRVEHHYDYEEDSGRCVFPLAPSDEEIAAAEETPCEKHDLF